jgi:Family of unknown function (DUF6010)
MPHRALIHGVSIAGLLAPILIALIFISLCSLLEEPKRRDFMAIMIAGAGAAYLNGGLGKWEFVFTAFVTWLTVEQIPAAISGFSPTEPKDRLALKGYLLILSMGRVLVLIYCSV